MKAAWRRLVTWHCRRKLENWRYLAAASFWALNGAWKGGRKLAAESAAWRRNRKSRIKAKCISIYQRRQITGVAGIIGSRMASVCRGAGDVLIGSKQLIMAPTARGAARENNVGNTRRGLAYKSGSMAAAWRNQHQHQRASAAIDENIAW